MFRLALAALLLLALPVTAFDSGDIAPGETWSHTFMAENADGYTYHCHPHPWMTAMVHVMPDDTSGVKSWNVDIVEGADSADWGYSVEHLVIEVGDTVVWRNTGQSVHTATMDMGDHHAGDHDHGGHDHAEDSPGLPIGLALVALAAFAARRR